MDEETFFNINRVLKNNATNDLLEHMMYVGHIAFITYIICTAVFICLLLLYGHPYSAIIVIICATSFLPIWGENTALLLQFILLSYTCISFIYFTWLHVWPLSAICLAVAGAAWVVVCCMT
jgi:hypothetical protein